MAQATIVKPVAAGKTCSNCPYFNNYYDPRGCGWCDLFDQQARTYHIQTNDCVNSSDIPISHELEDNLALFPDIDLDPFPTEVIELDRDGYPMSDDPVANAYFDPNFVTLPNEPF